MMQSFHEESGKAEGTSDPRRRRLRRNNTDSCVQPRELYEQTEPFPPYLEEHGRRDESPRHTPTRRHTTTRAPPNARAAPQPAREAEDEWDLVEEDEEALQESTTLPAYDFPGTWSAALQDTSAALSQVRTASSSYASALSSSGLSRAGRSIGAALWSTTNKKAVALAGWAVEQSGTDRRELPAPVRGWLSGGRRVDERRRAAQRRAAAAAGPYREPVTFGDVRGAFVLETREMDSTGEFVEERLEGDGEKRGEEEEGDE